MKKKRNKKGLIRFNTPRSRRLLVSGWLLLGAGVAVLPYSCREAYSREASSLARNLRVRANLGRISHGKALLKDGDLVLRTGNDFVSLTLRQFSRQNKTYSHCGIVRIVHGRVMIYHAIGGEDNPDARLRKDSFESFCNPEHNLGFGVFRYRLTSVQHRRLDSIVDLDYRLRIRFDMKFDLGTDSSLYCAEFVYKALTRATGEPHFMPVSQIGSFRYVAIDNLFLNNHCYPVYQAQFR